RLGAAAADPERKSNHARTRPGHVPPAKDQRPHAQAGIVAQAVIRPRNIFLPKISFWLANPVDAKGSRRENGVIGVSGGLLSSLPRNAERLAPTMEPICRFRQRQVPLPRGGQRALNPFPRAPEHGVDIFHANATCHPSSLPSSVSLRDSGRRRCRPKRTA